MISNTPAANDSGNPSQTRLLLWTNLNRAKHTAICVSVSGARIETTENFQSQTSHFPFCGQIRIAQQFVISLLIAL